eukprot:COSAG02_NODE_469_length_21727_cov_64.506334_4_plen_261_part_00
MHCANYSGEWNDAALHTLAKQPFVVFEKYHKAFEEPQLDQAEAKIAESCRKVKEINPQTDCYIYTESDWARTEYSLGHWFREHNESALQCDSPGNLDGKFVYTNDTLCNDWPPPLDGQQQVGHGGEIGAQKGCNGKLVHLTYLAYDFNNSEAREKWIERVTNVTATGHVNGAFIDGNRGGFGSGIIGSCSTKKKAAWVCTALCFLRLASHFSHSAGFAGGRSTRRCASLGAAPWPEQDVDLELPNTRRNEAVRGWDDGAW